MKAQTPYSFILMGLIIRLLRHSKGFSARIIVQEAGKLADNLLTAGFIVSAEGLNDLTKFTQGLEAEGNLDRVLRDSEVSALSEIMNVVEKMVFAEAQTKQIFLLSGRRYSLECLLYNPETMFKQGVFQALPLIAQSDLTEGFICILLARSTAAAFHILRATEAILREYYLGRVKRRREKVLLWWNMLKGLGTKRDKDSKLLERLDNIKRSYRNPTSHPEATYNLEEVQDLLGLCIDVINAMGAELHSTKGARAT